MLKRFEYQKLLTRLLKLFNEIILGRNDEIVMYHKITHTISKYLFLFFRNNSKKINPSNSANRYDLKNHHS